jgi:hypothetical protein
MGAVADVVEDVVGGVVNAVGDVAEAVVHAAGDVVQAVGDTATKVVETAVNDPIGTIAKVAAVATGQFELLPVISAVDVVAHGGNLEQALTSAAVSYVAPQVGGAIGSELADTAFGQALTDIGTNTGIESLPSAVYRGLGSAATQTAAGVLQGQDVGDALTGGITAGIGSGVGSAVTAEADTGGAGTNTLDKILGNTAGGVTTAALRGKDAYLAGVNAAAGSITGAGINAAGSGIASLNADAGPTKTAEETKSTETKPSGTLLASANEVVSDSGLTPTQEAIKNMKGEVEDQTPEQKAMVDQLIKALYPEEAKKEEEAKRAEAAATGNLIDDDGRITNFAINPETGDLYKPLGVNEFGDKFAPVLPRQDYVGSETMISPNVVSAILGDQEGDFPQQIENRADGSTVVTEFDGTQRIFNVDGTVETIGADGIKTTETNEGAKTITYDDGSTVTINPDGTVTSTEATDTPYTGETEKTSSNNDLSKLSSALLGGATAGGARNVSGTGGTGVSRKGTTGGFNLGNAGSLLGGAAAIGGAAALANSLNDTGTNSGGGFSPSLNGMSWDITDPAEIENARAYGQHMISPIYKAEGGLLSLTPPPYLQSPIQNQQYPVGDIPRQDAGSQPQQAYGQMPYTQPDQNQYGQMKPQFIQPTIDSQNHLNLNQPRNQNQNYNADYTNSVNMFAGGGMPIAMNDGGLPSIQTDEAIVANAARKYGLGDDVRVLNKIEALVNQGMNPDDAARIVAGSAKPTQMAMGAPMSRPMASGGISSLGHYSDGGRMLKGPGDGMSDDIPATIANKQPARLANEEFVIPADVVSHLGNGSSEAGAKVLYDMMAKVRKARTGNSKQGKQIHAEKFMPKMRG